MFVVGDHRRRAAASAERGRYGLVFFFALSISMVIFSLYGAQASVFQKARATLLDFFAPVLSVFSAPAHWVNGSVADVQEFLRLHDELDRLRDENAALRQYEEEVRSLRSQLAYYTDASEARLPPAARFVDAQVISESAGPFNRSLIISAGTSSNVREGNAVIDGDGLLGYISVSGSKAARVVPLTDPNSRIPVVLLSDDGEGDLVEALLTGQSRGAPVLDVFSQRLDRPLALGTRVVTSGAGGMMPRGIPIGQISDVSDARIAIELDANTRTPNLVRVVDFQFPTSVVPDTDQEADVDGGR